MARRKTKKKGGLLSFFSKKKKKSVRSKRKKSNSFTAGLKVSLSIMFLTLLIGGGATALIYMDRFVKRHQIQNQMLPVNLYYRGLKPEWLQQEWYNQIFSTIGSREFVPSENLARDIQTRLEQIPWLYKPVVKITPNEIKISSGYRRPVATLMMKGVKYYVDDELVVFNYIPSESIVTPEIVGSSLKTLPVMGSILHSEDIKAGVDIINYLIYNDNLCLNKQYVVPPPLKKIIKDFDNSYFLEKYPTIASKIQKPILNEFESIDVSNYNVRSRLTPQIVLYSHDGTPIYWGAVLGESDINAEAREEEKIVFLYRAFVNNNNSLQLKGIFKRLDIRQPEKLMPYPR